MSEPETTPADGDGEMSRDGAPGAARAGYDAEEVERMATRAADALQRILSTDREARGLLVQALHRLSALQTCAGEWQELHDILHKVIVSFSPFHARLCALGCRGLEPVDKRMLLTIWRLCQTELDQLIDAESQLETIPCFSRYAVEGAAQQDWVARIVALRREMESNLRQESWRAEELIDLADEFGHACTCYLNLVERELGQRVEAIRRLYSRLFGGLA